MTVDFHRKEFAAHSACQTITDLIWRGGLPSAIGTWKFIVCAFLPAMVPLILKPNLRHGITHEPGLFRRFFSAPMVKFCYQLMSFAWSFDLLMYLCMVLHLLLYVFPFEGFRETGVLAIGVLFGYIHIITTFFVHKTLGPKVVIFKEMAKDFCRLLPFAGLLIVGFGVAYHALQYPNTAHRHLWHALQGFLVPYFQMYGKIDLEYFQGLFIDKDNPLVVEGREKRAEPWDDTRDPLTRYPDINPMLPWLVFVYLILMNIMFLNIVVSQLNFRFQEIERNSLVISRYHLMRFVVTFSRYRLRRFTHCKCKKDQGEFQSASPDLDQFEKAATEKYLLTRHGKLKDQW
ncbi:hypothetical protein ACOMHN_045157 [Nucella lapillus]